MQIKEDINKYIFRGYDIRGVFDKDIDIDTAYTIGLGFGSKLYDLSSDSDIQQVNELASTNNEFLNFILYCHYTNYTVTIKETGKTYNPENIPRAIPFVEGKNTIVVELTDKYGHSRKISNTINVKKVGQIK